MLVFFQNEHPCAFGQNEPIAVGIEGAGTAFGRVVPGTGHDLHEDETLYDSQRNRRVCSAA